jgi:hypothetical protein
MSSPSLRHLMPLAILGVYSTGVGVTLPARYVYQRRRARLTPPAFRMSRAEDFISSAILATAWPFWAVGIAIDNLIDVEE